MAIQTHPAARISVDVRKKAMSQAAVEKQPLQFIRLPLCRVPADRFGRSERGLLAPHRASRYGPCIDFSASSRHPVRRYLHIRRPAARQDSSGSRVARGAAAHAALRNLPASLIVGAFNACPDPDSQPNDSQLYEHFRKKMNGGS